MDIEQIWQAYKQSLKAFLHSRISQPEDVDDLLQDIFIKTFTKLEQLENPSSIKPWLFQLANNTITDYYRKKATHGTNFISQQEAEQLIPFELTNDEQTKQNLVNCIQPFLQQLPAKEAQLIKAIDIESHSQKAYAEAHQLSYSTLKSQVQKSRRNLKAVFDNCCHFYTDKDGRVFDYQRKPDFKLGKK
ncbi:RNA polymerase sigma factor SigZ [Catenovulum sp. SM1970]|uniref:RNA polymerase sigma factor SigZ n=1 Tax=Marinifaba aquimaris TaxID=2741323 RepID=UPI001571E972|nr:RNA polymerase sigma factor SigZ [Marinifaba aquimaris]NTS78001.1 RNA polymerase sigma factor SigZ [Marinifaba aquimaris]